MVTQPRFVQRDKQINVIKEMKIKCFFCKKVYCTGWLNAKPICARCRRILTKPKRKYHTGMYMRRNG